MTREPLRKRLSYRLPVSRGSEAATAEQMARIWRGVEWNAGPVIVAWVSQIYGTCQVWAADEIEGRRVVSIAIDHMQAREEDGEWIVTTSGSERMGRRARMRATVVSARSSPNGVAPHIFLT